MFDLNKKINKIKNNKKFIILITAFFIMSCGGNCDSLDKSFTSYDNAIELVRATNFNIEDKVNTDSSWIDSIEYYSCDEVVGYLIVNTKRGNSFIHKNVPIQLWNQFKNADSFGRFYNQRIKGSYYLSLN